MCCCSVLYSHTMDLTTACLCVNGIAICVLFGVSCNIVMFYNVTKKNCNKLINFSCSGRLKQSKASSR